MHTDKPDNATSQRRRMLPGARQLTAICMFAFSIWHSSILLANDGFNFEFFRLSDDIDVDGQPGSGFIVDASGNILLFFVDFDDFHEFDLPYDSLTTAGLPKSGAVDVVNVVWLGDPLVKPEGSDSNIIRQPAEALRVRDFQYTGIDDAAIAPSSSLRQLDVSSFPEMATFEIEDGRNGVGLIRLACN